MIRQNTRHPDKSRRHPSQASCELAGQRFEAQGRGLVYKLSTLLWLHGHGGERFEVWDDLSPTGDFAIVRVDREITAPGAVALKVRDSGEIGVGRNIGVIGHPTGLPVKIAFGAATVVMKEDDPWLFANLDTYGGNSGSAVFNTEGLVEGILVRGARDYDIEPTCFKSNKIMDSEGSEAVTKASAFVDKIPGSGSGSD